MPSPGKDLATQLMEELGLTFEEAGRYLEILRAGGTQGKKKDGVVESLLSKGMIIMSGDNSRFIPVHPRLAVSNGFRTWRDRMVKEINERRMRVDKIVLQLIPIYEAATEKRATQGSG